MPVRAHVDERERSPRIKGFESYDDGLLWIVNRLRRREVAGFEYHHYTTFRIAIRYVGTAYEMSVAVGDRRPLTSYVMLGSYAPVWRTIAREFGLLDDDARTVHRLLVDVGNANRECA